MQIRFPGTSAQHLIAHLNDQIQQRKLHSLITTQYNHNELIIIISKFGTSKLRFAIEEQQPTQTQPHHPTTTHLPCTVVTQITLIHKKITFTHRPIERDLVTKLQTMITHLGGEIICPYVL